MKKIIDRFSILLLMVIILIPLPNMKVHAEEMKTTDKTYTIAGEKLGESLVVLGVKWANDEISIHSGTNILEVEIGKIEKDSEVKYYNELANGWVRILHEDGFGYIDKQLLRDTEVVDALKEVMPETSEAPKKKVILKTYIGNDGVVKVVNPEEEPVPDKAEVARMMTGDIPLNKVEDTTVKTEQVKAPIPEGKKTITFKLSYYTNFLSENGGYTNTASGKPLAYGVIASNVYPLGTKIYLEGYGEMTVLDRGGKHFDSPDRLDVHIPPKEGEGRAEYKKRVMAMGRQTTIGYILD